MTFILRHKKIKALNLSISHGIDINAFSTKLLLNVVRYKINLQPIQNLQLYVMTILTVNVI